MAEGVLCRTRGGVVLMLHEFALDPQLISDRHSARYFFDACKPEKGRLISQYPKKWKRMVFRHCQEILPDGSSLKYIEERLRKLDASLVRTSRTYDSEKDWLVNAVASHNEEPFRAIVSPSPGPGVLAAEVDENTPDWKTDVCITVERKPADLTIGCCGLLKQAKELVFIDPYFDGARAQMRVFKALLAEALSGLALGRIEYHVKENRLDHQAYVQRIQNDILPQLPLLPAPLHIIRWQDGNETLHDRYILTDLAGVSIPQGLSECRAEESDTTEVSLLSQETFERRRTQYSAENTGDFKFVDGWRIENGRIESVSRKDGEWCVAAS